MNLSSLTQKITVRTVAFLFVVVSVLFIVLGLYKTSDADASAVSGFQAGRIIDDSVFYNAGSMSANQIQTFLNSKVTCDTDGTAPATDWGRPDITHATLASYIRNGTNGYTKNTNFHAPPYTCLKNFKQNTPQVEAASGLCGGIPARTSRTAAQIILDVSNACGINPQVLLVLLEKEQSLVTDTWPLNHQYNRATGFACPDNVGGACDPKFNGFYSQVYAAARQFKVYKAYPTSYNYIAGRTNNILWQVVPDGSKEGIFFTNGSPSSRRNGHCGYSQVTIQNQATAALYIYTPYRPNSAALSSYPGTGDACSAYGNRNFYGMFTSWFGSPTGFKVSGGIATKYNALGGAAVIGTVKSAEIPVAGGVYQQFEKGRIYWKKDIGATYLTGGIGKKFLSMSWFGFPMGDEVAIPSGSYQQFEKGRIYWDKESSSAIRVSGGIGTEYKTLNWHEGSLGKPLKDELSLSGGAYQQFEKGRIYWTSSQAKAVRIFGGINTKYVSAGATNSNLGFPVDIEVAIPSGSYQQFEKGRIYWDKESSSAIRIGGGIGTLYAEMNYHSGNLGKPLKDEVGISRGAYQQFEKGRIYWSSKTGSVRVSGGIGTRYINLGAANSNLGFPTGDEVAIPSGSYQQFEKGRIYWDKTRGALSVSGGIGTKYFELNAEQGKLGVPQTNEVATKDTVYQLFAGGKITWKQGSAVVSYK